MKFGLPCRFLGLCLLFFQLSAQAQATGEPLTREYFAHQAEGEALLIRINGFEAEFESTVFAPGGSPIMVSRLEHSRMTPLFQFIEAPERERQLDIVISSRLFSNRAGFELGLTRLPVHDDRSATLAWAYQLLSVGLRADGATSTPDWTVKIGSLLTAGRKFEEFGMEELRLWALYFAAHLVHFHLQDHYTVMEFTNEILARTRGSRLGAIGHAALQLQSLALIEIKAAGALTATAANPDPAQERLEQAAELAESLGYKFEQALAIKRGAEDLVRSGRYPDALLRFELALAIADGLAIGELETDIRKQIVEIHDVRGDAMASGEVLQDIEEQLAESGANDELAENLLQQGRLLLGHRRYAEAIEVLILALEHERNTAARSQVNLALARAHYEGGRFDKALAALRASIFRPGTSEFRRPGGRLDIGEGLRIKANIHRLRHEYESLQQAREAQQQHLRSTAEQAAYWNEKGLDALAQGLGHLQRAQSHFRQSQQAASRAGQTHRQALAGLQICILAVAGPGSCTRSDARQYYEQAIGTDLPRHAAEATLLWAQFLQNTGNRAEAFAALDKLVDDVHFYRDSLPGVLGSWYWTRQRQLFETYMTWAVAGAGEGYRSLLALSKLRLIEGSPAVEHVPGRPGPDFAEVNELKASLAQLEQGGDDSAQLRAQIENVLDVRRKSFQQAFEHMTDAGLRTYLGSLTGKEAVLTYYLTPGSALAWVGKKDGVQLVVLPRRSEIIPAVESAEARIAISAGASFDKIANALGDLLLAPLAGMLPETIYFIPARPLSRIPLDAARLDGRYLAENHQLVNLLSFPAGNAPGARFGAAPMQRIFLAGDPQNYSGEFALGLNISPELQLVTDQFRGPGLQIVQREALLPDEFSDERFLSAQLLHLAMPGIVDLEAPERSHLELSEGRRNSGRSKLGANAIRSRQILARLVFLSGTQFTGSEPFGHGKPPALVSAFLAAGAEVVLASLWTGEAGANNAMVSDFYRKLEDSGNIAAALADTKRQFIAGGQTDGLREWARFQLFIE